MSASAAAAQPRRSAVGRADLAIVLGSMSADAARRAAAFLGYEERKRPEDRQAEAAVTPPERVAPEIAPAPPIERPLPPGPMSFWRLESMSFEERVDQDAEPEAEVVALAPDEISGPHRTLLDLPTTPPLAPWSRLWPLVRSMIAGDARSSRPDVRALVRALARGRVVRRIPRAIRRGWPSDIELWIDRSRRLVPFWADQNDLARRIELACGCHAVRQRTLTDRDQASLLRRSGDFAERHCAIAPGTAVLVLGDLGSYADADLRRAWLLTARRLRRADQRLAALVPCPKARWDREAASAWAAEPWERARADAQAPALEPEELAARADHLLKLVSPSARTEPGLLRAVRHLLPRREADAGTEVDVWRHPDVWTGLSSAMLLDPAAARRLRRDFAARRDEQLQRDVARLICEWHERLPAELLHGETLIWQAAGIAAEPPGDPVAARQLIHRMAGTAQRSSADEDACLVAGYGGALFEQLPNEVLTDPEMGESYRGLWVYSRRGKGGSPPAGVDVQDAYRRLDRSRKPRWWSLRQVGSRLVAFTSNGNWDDRAGIPGSPVAWLEAAWPEVTPRADGRAAAPIELEGPEPEVELRAGAPLDLRTGRCALRVGLWRRKQRWTVAAGRDRFGLWQDVDIHGIPHRFRWIPPGRFVMGSPESEAGRDSDEGPQHEVTLTKGYWLGETPVTQALWTAVMGDNPSEYQSDDRPVEQVSWEECERFVRSVNDAMPELALRLPTEAEWEHACRAGTSTATWLGDLEIRGRNNAPLLDPIAWYGGNCGVDFELENGWDTKGELWEEKQYEFSQGGTHPVRLKQPNPFGLYDMLGNVLEWCADWYGPYTSEPMTDPRGPESGSYRVFRGGSWYSFARLVRAAYRYWYHPSARNDGLGFRLARGQVLEPGAEPQVAEPRRPPIRVAGRDPTGGAPWRGPASGEPAGRGDAEQRDAERPPSRNKKKP